MKKETVIESILDLNSTNVWKLTEQEIRDALGLSADEPLEYTLSKNGYRGGMSTRAVGSYNVYVDGVLINEPYIALINSAGQNMAILIMFQLFLNIIWTQYTYRITCKIIA